MNEWDEFVAWLDGFTKIDQHAVSYTDDDKNMHVAIATPFGVSGEDEELVKQELMFQIKEFIGDEKGKLIWVRVIPEVVEEKTSNLTPTGTFTGYARIVCVPGDES